MFSVSDLPPRIAAKIAPDENGCWIWTGGRFKTGYGSTRWDGRTWYVHRLTYTLLVGPIPSGRHIDHLCRVRACANPAHMEPVIQRTNTLRGESPVARNVTKTHCPKGHPYSGENLMVIPIGDWFTRRCRTCISAYKAELYQRQRRRSHGLTSTTPDTSK